MAGKRELCFDTETTGLDPNSGHRVVEIGCVEMIDTIRTGKDFHVYINPERDMPPEAERIHGLSSEFLADKPVFKDIAGAFVEFVGQSDLVAHNAGFDMKFINYELKQAGYATIPALQSVDTLEIARKRYPGQPASLDALCRKFDIDLTARTKHGALLDAELLADVYLELMGGRQSHLGLGSKSPSDANITAADAQHTVVDFPVRHFPASATERQAHAVFIRENVPGAIWEKYLENT